MGRVKKITCFVLGIGLASCGGSAAQFPFRYYNLQANKYDGSLVGDKPENDLPLRKCEPNAQDRAPCQVLLSSELKRLKISYLNLQVENQNLQKKLAQCQPAR